MVVDGRFFYHEGHEEKKRERGHEGTSGGRLSWGSSALASSMLSCLLLVTLFQAPDILQNLSLIRQALSQVLFRLQAYTFWSFLQEVLVA